MPGSTFGTLFRVTTWGESHGSALGAVVDGMPAGIPLNEEYVQQFLDRRRPGRSVFTTARSETDTVRILSGVFEGKTTGTPISMLVENKDQRSRDYSQIKDCYRPGHADHTFDMKYGFRDYRGGGRSSGRETIGRVCGGSAACAFLRHFGIQFTTYAESIGPFSCDPSKFDPEHLRTSLLSMPDPDADLLAQDYLKKLIAQGDSAGGRVACTVSGIPAGLGEPVFDKLDARLGSALFSIGAVKAVEIGDGVGAAGATGLSFNDQYAADAEGNPEKLTNHAGGVLGGISDGSDLFLRVTFKPTPSISTPQHALMADGTVKEISIHGRHDPVIVPRAVVVVESMAAMTIADLLLMNLGSRMDRIRVF